MITNDISFDFVHETKLLYYEYPDKNRRISELRKSCQKFSIRSFFYYMPLTFIYLNFKCLTDIFRYIHFSDLKDQYHSFI